MDSWRAWKLTQEENQVWKCSLINASDNGVRTEVLAGSIISSMLKSHNYSHHAVCMSCRVQRGGKLRKGQARALDHSWRCARFNIAPLTCSYSTQTPFRQSFLSLWEWAAGRTAILYGKQLYFLQTVPGMKADSISNTCMLTSAFGEQLLRLPELCYGKQQGSKCRANQGELSLEFPQMFPKDRGTCSLHGHINPLPREGWFTRRLWCPGHG